MKLTLRLVTVICYFLPFTFFLSTCNNGLELRFSYNQAEADKNISLEKESSEVAVTDTAQFDQSISIDTTNTNTATQTVLTDTVKTSSDTLQKSTDYGDRILRKMLFPTDTSLSGIGSILYFKNLLGQIAIAVCLLISLVLFIAFRFLKSKKAKIFLLLTAVLFLTIFIVDSFVSSVTLLWGSWTLLLLLVLQLIIEYNHRRKAYR
jgi:4-amino-4-deoxy-L-arabinose transferase-like glycosyltransferase